MSVTTTTTTSSTNVTTFNHITAKTPSLIGVIRNVTYAITNAILAVTALVLAFVGEADDLTRLGLLVLAVLLAYSTYYSANRFVRI